MQFNIVKNFATWAHRELIERITLRAKKFGITEDEIRTLNADTIDGISLTSEEKGQRDALIDQVQNVGFRQTIEDAAYAWFYRICVLRFMEINQLFPDQMRIFTNTKGEFQLQTGHIETILTQRLSNFDVQHIETRKNNKSSEAWNQYLWIQLCEALSIMLPGVFLKLEEATKLLCPDQLASPQGIVGRLIADIPESYFNIQDGHGQVEIIGWLYQYYFSEKREEIIDPLYGKSISQTDIPTATQIFTPDWVIQYIIDNTIGKYWLEHHPDSKLAQHLHFYIAPQTTPTKRRAKTKHPPKPQDITIFDPCVGSGHFLTYAIDVLMYIYREQGYTDHDAIAEIFKYNIYGVDVDQRVVDLAYFAMAMKGCQYDSGFLQRQIQPHIYAMRESCFITEDFIQYFAMSDQVLSSGLSDIADLMQDAKAIGSMLVVPELPLDRIMQRLHALQKQPDLFYAQELKALQHLICTLQLLSQRYTAVITNPPYLNKYDKKLKSYILKHYKDYSGDLFSIFIYLCTQFCIPQGYTGLMTPNVWMFIKSYKKLRQYISQNHSITTLVQMAKGAFFDIATVDVCAFVIQAHKPNQSGIYFRLEEFIGNMNIQRQKLHDAIQDPLCTYRYTTSCDLFKALPGNPIGYWASHAILKSFQIGLPLETYASPRQGLATTDNKKYLRLWYEVDFNDIGFEMSQEHAIHSSTKWFPYNKGGEYRKWYGNQNYIVNYQYNGQEIKKDVLTKYPYLKTPTFVVKNPETYFFPCLSWSKISSGRVAFRYFPQGFLYDVSGCSIFFKTHQDLLLYAGFLNSNVCIKCLEIISPTLNYEAGHISILPIILPKEKQQIQNLVQENIEMAKQDWDDFETSWHFKKHPLVDLSTLNHTVSDQFKKWEDTCNQRFCRTKHNEETINRIFIETYQLQDELKSQIDDKHITIRKANLTREVKSLISYAVGCMFGRYALDREGLCSSPISQTDNVNHSSKSLFIPVTDNIIPITEDGFCHDIVHRFCDFIAAAYGPQLLETNLQFIADALGGKGSPEERIRHYFLNEFYADHVKIYQKRPIYWLFSAGKQNSFKCLIYIHKYQPDLLINIQNQYIESFQTYYLDQISSLTSTNLQTSESHAIYLKQLHDQIHELHVYKEKLSDYAQQRISLCLDDGITANYHRFKDILETLK